MSTIEDSDTLEDTEPRQEQPGIVVGGRFVLLRQIGAGAMGTVFEAEDQRMRRRVALKILGRAFAQPVDAGRRFRREARAAAGIQHPNVVTIHDFGQRRDGTCYIVQELLTGVDLRGHLEENRRLTHAEALEIMVPIMGALIAAHRKGVIHRDLKPENIFLAEAALGAVVVPKLIDFGIALAPDSATQRTQRTQRTSTGRRGLVGSLCYMSPEQARDEKLDGRVDVWAAGTVIFELLHGTTPFHAPTWVGVMHRLLSDEPVPRITTLVEGVPSELADILERSLARRLDDRYPSMDAFLQALLGFARRSLPGLVQRHAASIPRYVESVPPPAPSGDADGGDEGALQPVASTRRPFVRPDLEGMVGAAGASTSALDLVARAEEDLRVNALEEALAHAAQAIEDRSGKAAEGELYGRMRLVQASAGRWVGRFADAERWAREALANLPRGSRRWYTAFGHLALVSGYLGHNDKLPALADELGMVEGRGDSGAHIMAANRLVVSLVRAGRLDLAQHVFERGQGMAVGLSMEEPDVLAWMDVGNAELELNSGHLTTYLQLLEAAVAGFVEAGALRNACLQRANIGNAYMRLGLYARAEQTLRSAALVGEPMKLNFIGPVRANLGFALARLGQLDQAFEIETAALDQCVRQGNRRFETAAHLYLAEILRLRGDVRAAEQEARRAVDAGAAAPGVRAHALAMLGDILLELGRPADALVVSSEALAVLESLDGVEEGESLIRLVHALALGATGDLARASLHARQARQRLLDLAAKISEPAWRRSFLDNVPEHARTRALEVRG